MKNIFTITAMGLVASIALSTAATASDTRESSIQYYGDAQPGKYDKKLEAAAIKRAGEKVGDLRGSLEGIDSTFIVKPTDLKADQSSHLGFPVIRETLPARPVDDGAVPIV